MKKLITIIILAQLNYNTFSQNRFSTTGHSEYTSQYVPTNFDAIKSIGDAMEAKYEKNKDYKNKLIDWIFELKSKISDKEFLIQLNYQYNNLNEIEISSSSGESLDLIRQYIVEEIDKLNTRRKEEPNKLWESGNKNLKSGNYSQAIQDYTNLIKFYPDYSPIYTSRGSAYFIMGNYSQALLDLNKSIDLKNDVEFVFSQRGWVKYYLNDYIGSLADFNRQIELHPTAEAYYNRGSSKSKLGDENGAISDYTKSIDLDPKYSMAYNNRGWSKYLLKKYAEAILDLNKAIEIDPLNWVAYDSRQETKFALNDFKGCIEDCNKALSINIKCSNSFFIRGRSYYKQGNKIKACEDFSKSGELGNIKAYEYISKFCK